MLSVLQAVAFGIGDQLLGQLSGVGHDPLEHGLEMGNITCIVANPHRRDDLVVAIDRDLADVALNPAVSTLRMRLSGSVKLRWALPFGSPAAVVGRLRLGIAKGSTLLSGCGVERGLRHPPWRASSWASISSALRSSAAIIASSWASVLSIRSWHCV
jgi:hypothetical protein